MQRADCLISPHHTCTHAQQDHGGREKVMRSVQHICETPGVQRRFLNLLGFRPFWASQSLYVIRMNQRWDWSALAVFRTFKLITFNQEWHHSQFKSEPYVTPWNRMMENVNCCIPIAYVYTEESLAHVLWYIYCVEYFYYISKGLVFTPTDSVFLSCYLLIGKLNNANHIANKTITVTQKSRFESNHVESDSVHSYFQLFQTFCLKRVRLKMRTYEVWH